MQTHRQMTSRAQVLPIPSGFVWLKHLDVDEQAEFISGLLRRILSAIKDDDWSPVVEWVEEWKATANVQADPKISRSVKQGSAELARGEFIEWDTLRKELDL